ncbi:hypothetical protein D3C87_2157940 [compost metagenome]
MDLPPTSIGLCLDELSFWFGFSVILCAGADGFKLLGNHAGASAVKTIFPGDEFIFRGFVASSSCFLSFLAI